MGSFIIDFVLDEFTPKLSELTENNAPDLIFGQQEYWMLNYLRNFDLEISRDDRLYIIDFLRRTDNSLHEYANARHWLEEYLSGDRDVVSKYFRAAFHFEQCLAQAYQAHVLEQGLVGVAIFKRREEGSLLEKLNIMYNHNKHIETVNFLRKLAFPMWITNNGLESPTTFLAFSDLVQILTDLGNSAVKLTINE